MKWFCLTLSELGFPGVEQKQTILLSDEQPQLEAAFGGEKQRALTCCITYTLLGIRKHKPVSTQFFQIGTNELIYLFIHLRFHLTIYTPHWPQTCCLPALTSWLLALQVWVTIPSLDKTSFKRNNFRII